MKQMRSVHMYVNAAHVLSIAVPGDMVSSVYHETSLTCANSVLGKRRTSEASTYDKIIVHYFPRLYVRNSKLCASTHVPSTNAHSKMAKSEGYVLPSPVNDGRVFS